MFMLLIDDDMVFVSITWHKSSMREESFSLRKYFSNPLIFFNVLFTILLLLYVQVRWRVDARRLIQDRLTTGALPTPGLGSVT